MVRDGRLELPTSCSQSKRATNCANPGFWVIEFCTRCGQTCGQADFLTTSAYGEIACISGVSRDCGHSIFRLEGGATRSQSKRATNCATPGYEVFRLWSNMWSTPVFDQLPARGKALSVQVSQGIPGFPRTTARTPVSRSQSRRATNCATPGYEVVGWPGRILPNHPRYQLR